MVSGELLDEDQSFRWLVRGLLVGPTYGMLAGEKKTLKSYVSTFMKLAVSGHEILNGDGQITERWRPRELRGGGHQVCLID